MSLCIGQHIFILKGLGRSLKVSMLCFSLCYIVCSHTAQRRLEVGADALIREFNANRAGLRGGGGVGMGVSGMVFVGLVLGCIEAKFCK